MLPENEMKVLRFLLENTNDFVTASEIKSATGMGKTVYDILASLEKKKLIKKTIHNNLNHYEIYDINNYISRTEEKITDTKKSINLIKKLREKRPKKKKTFQEASEIEKARMIGEKLINGNGKICPLTNEKGRWRVLIEELPLN